MSPFVSETVSVVLAIILADTFMIAARYLIRKGVPHQ